MPIERGVEVNEHMTKERRETDAIRAEALRLGLDISHTAGWWWEDVDNFSGSLQEWEFLKSDYMYLTELGKAGAKRLIKEEFRRLEIESRKDIEWKRQNTQWKLTIAGIIIGWILGISGIVVAVVSLLRK